MVSTRGKERREKKDEQLGVVALNQCRIRLGVARENVVSDVGAGWVCTSSEENGSNTGKKKEGKEEEKRDVQPSA